MNPAFLDNMSWEMAEVYGAVTDRILINLAKYFKYYKPGEPVPRSTFEYQARMLAQMGQVSKETMQIIRNGLDGADEALKNTLEQAVIDAVSKAEPELLDAVKKGVLSPAGMPIVAPNQMQAFQRYYQQAADKLNLVNTVMLESTKSAYQQAVSGVIADIELAKRVGATQFALDAATGEVVTGVSSWNQALKNATEHMANRGITGFVDHGGHQWSAEAYAAMDIRTTVANTARAAVWETNQNFGNDLYSVSYHNGARPGCYPWQNKVVSSTDNARTVTDLDGNEIVVIAQSATSYGQPAGLFGINCKHYPTPFIPGVSLIRGEPQSPEENAKTYEESQHQRALERKIREQKRDLDMMKAQGASPEAIKAQRAKIRETDDEIDAFCEQTGRTRRQNREAVYTKRDFPDKEKYDVAAFEHEQQDRIREYYEKGGAQQGYTFGQMTPNTPPIPQTPSTPQIPQQQTPTPNATPQTDTIEKAIGVKRGAPMTIEEARKGVNPGYYYDVQNKVNCQRCVQTYELRRRGYDVEAMPKPKNPKDNRVVWGSECFNGYGTSQGNAVRAYTLNQTAAQVKKELSNAPDGARYSVYIKWKSARSAHVFIAEKVNGVVQYLDPQDNTEDASGYFARGSRGKFGFFRMDDKPITTDETLIKQTVKKGGTK